MIRVDKQATEAARFLDDRSYVGMRIHPGTVHACVYLFGGDASLARQETRKKYEGHCFDCGCWCWISGETDHVIGGLGQQRCWCPENLAWRCRPCHAKKHGRYPRFGTESRL